MKQSHTEDPQILRATLQNLVTWNLCTDWYHILHIFWCYTFEFGTPKCNVSGVSDLLALPLLWLCLQFLYRYTSMRLILVRWSTWNANIGPYSHICLHGWILLACCFLIIVFINVKFNYFVWSRLSSIHKYHERCKYHECCVICFNSRTFCTMKVLLIDFLHEESYFVIIFYKMH
jgi:hypothetical protein